MRSIHDRATWDIQYSQSLKDRPVVYADAVQDQAENNKKH